MTNSKNRTLIVAIVGATVGIGILLTAKQYLLVPYLESMRTSAAPILSSQEIADNLRRDQIVADGIAKLDARSKVEACAGYIGGLKEQKLVVSPIIQQACAK